MPWSLWSQKTMHSGPNFMNNLPDEVSFCLQSFLDDCDIAMLSSCNHTLRSQFPIARLKNPPLLLPNIRLFIRDDTPNCYDFFYNQNIPVVCFLSRRTRSVQLSCRWKGNGWPSDESQLAILATVRFQNQEPANRISLGDLQQQHHRLVCCTADTGGYNWHQLVLKFTPRPDEVYHLFLKPCGTGNPVLYLEDIRIHTVIMDKPDRSISRNYQILSKVNINQSPFLLQLFQRCVATLQDRFLRSDDAHHPDSLTQFLESQGIAVDRSSLESIQELLAHYFETHVSQVYARSLASANPSVSG